MVSIKRKKHRHSNRNAFLVSIVIMACVSFVLFIHLKSISERYVFEVYKEGFIEDTSVAAGVFSDVVSGSISNLANMADNFDGFESFHSEDAIEVLRVSEVSEYISDLGILYGDGTMINATGEKTVAESEMISEIFKNKRGISMLTELQDSNSDNLTVYVPLVEGKTELVGTVNFMSTVRQIGMINSDITRIILFNAGTGRIILDADNKSTGAGRYLPYNVFNYIKNSNISTEKTYDEFRKDINQEKSGFLGIREKSDNKVNYIAYTPVGYSDWYVLQIMHESALEDELVKFDSTVREAFIVFVVILFIVLCLLFVLMRRGSIISENIRVQKIRDDNLFEAQGRLISSISDELKTPIDNMLETIKLCDINAEYPDRVRYYLGNQKNACNQLALMIDDMIDTASFDKNDDGNSEKEVNLGNNLHELINLAMARMQEKNITCKISVEGVIHENVICDEKKLTRILINVIDNAEKSIGENGSIYICLSETQTENEGISEYEYMITDNGNGEAGLGIMIAGEMLRQLGGYMDIVSDAGEDNCVIIHIPMQVNDEKFSDEDIQMLKKYEGKTVIVVDDDDTLASWMNFMVSSLGMKCMTYKDVNEAFEAVKLICDSGESIALMIFGWKMEGMSGTELAYKMRDVAGNEVPIIIQTSNDYSYIHNDSHIAAVNKFMTEPIFKSDLIRFMKDISSKYEEKGIQFPDFSGKRILLADDRKKNIQALMEWLNYTGAKVDVEYDAEIAVSRFAKKGDWYYDVILMDVRMPGMSGYEATKAIRNIGTDYAQNIPIIAMLANSFMGDVKKTEEAGMTSYLVKPLKYNEVYGELNKYIGLNGDQ